MLNLYLICDYGNYDSLIEYKSTLADLGNILESEIFNDVFCLGDMNADPSKGRFYRELSNFCNNYSLEIADVERLPPNSFTFVSHNDVCSTSFLDLVICSNSSFIAECNIFYGVTLYDHIPIGLELNLPVSIFDTDNSNFSSVPVSTCNMVNWEKVTEYDSQVYCETLDELCL